MDSARASAVKLKAYMARMAHTNVVILERAQDLLLSWQSVLLPLSAGPYEYKGKGSGGGGRRTNMMPREWPSMYASMREILLAVRFRR
jgi:hypothetical protein